MATHGEDEVGRLTDVFNGMTTALESLTQSLELRVKERTHALAEANAKLQELDRRKSQSLLTTSHELRTPLTSMKLHLDNLLDGVGGHLTDKQTSILKRVRTNIYRLQQFVEEALDLPRIESEQTTLSRDPVDPACVVSGAIDSLVLVAQERDIAIEHHTIAAAPAILGDPAKLMLVFTNLIQNASNSSSQDNSHHQLRHREPACLPSSAGPGPGHRSAGVRPHFRAVLPTNQARATGGFGLV